MSEFLKIAHALFKGHMNVDLPWSEEGVVPCAGDTPWTPIVLSNGYVTMSTSFLQEWIDFGLQHIVQVKALTAHYENQVVEFRLLFDVASNYGQKGEIMRKKQ